MKKKKKKIKKRCHHSWAAWEKLSDELVPYRVCTSCWVTQFKGDRYSYGSRQRDDK
jgi:hypothetical protein